MVILFVEIVERVGRQNVDVRDFCTFIACWKGFLTPKTKVQNECQAPGIHFWTFETNFGNIDVVGIKAMITLNHQPSIFQRETV